MLEKNARRVIAAGSVAAILLFAAPPAQAGCDVHGGCTVTPTYPSAKLPWAPGIGKATSGVSGGPITATATWVAPSPDLMNTEPITGYRVRANAYKYEQVPQYDANTQRLLGWVWVRVLVGTTSSDVQPADARTLTMTLPGIASYTFQVQAINNVGESAFSAASNLVTGQ